MKFCGRCGLQLVPESTACPRCREITEMEDFEWQLPESRLNYFVPDSLK